LCNHSSAAIAFKAREGNSQCIVYAGSVPYSSASSMQPIPFLRLISASKELEAWSERSHYHLILSLLSK
jgi:hypothetical protein